MWALRRNLTLKDIHIDCEAYQRKEKASKDFDKLGQKSKELDGETQVNKADIAGPNGMSGVKKQRGNNRAKKGGRGGNNSNRGGSNNTQVYDSIHPQKNQGYGQPRGDIMLDIISKDILHVTLTKGMLAITLQIITNNSILFSKVIRISGAMVDREDTQVGVETLEVEEDQVGLTHPTILATMGVCTRTVRGVKEA